MPEPYRNIYSWVWPAAVLRRLQRILVVTTAYTAAVYFLYPSNPDMQGGWLAATSLINSLVLGALVGFRTKAAYDRWWEGRCLWGELTNHSRNLCLKAIRLADPPAADRRELFDLVAGFPFALMRHLREGVKLQEVPGFGTDAATPAHVPAELAGRVLALIRRWKAEGRIDGFGQLALDPHATAYMNVCGACEKVRNTPLPGTFLALLRHGLLFSFLLLPWHLVHVLGVWALLVQAVIVYFLLGIELTAEEVEQPFAYDPDDLPLEQFCATVRTNAAELLGVGDPGAG
ncbi:bestrophin family protein [Urbifossiella limnaea]|uniref:Bestrophin, RFP-TM, chloride channel n=1 Tax=Urbifossiella limnaea TaxID=2528023 RepID=A0A517XP93_9BACT|nr:bestrophin family ion channel [Urbifossiella limnaea]QDU19318.1 Bestrophin, RFP-TM, chloride channel [Urbifossiella limnaea]